MVYSARTINIRWVNGDGGNAKRQEIDPYGQYRRRAERLGRNHFYFENYNKGFFNWVKIPENLILLNSQVRQVS